MPRQEGPTNSNHDSPTATWDFCSHYSGQPQTTPGLLDYTGTADTLGLDQWWEDRWNLLDTPTWPSMVSAHIVLAPLYFQQPIFFKNSDFLRMVVKSQIWMQRQIVEPKFKTKGSESGRSKFQFQLCCSLAV